VTDLIKHMVTVAFPLCTELSAAQHVFAVPSFLALRRAKNAAAGDVRLLEGTVPDAAGARANSVYFPLAN